MMPSLPNPLWRQPPCPWMYASFRWGEPGAIDIDALCAVFAKDGCRPPQVEALRRRLPYCNRYDTLVVYHDPGRMDWLRSELEKIGATVEFA